VKRIAALLVSLMLAIAALPALQVQLAAAADSCPVQDLSESQTSGRVTVVYDDHNLIDPADDPTGNIADEIALAVAAEGDEALSLYAGLGFGDKISGAVTVKLTCRTVNPLNDQRALTLGADAVELPVSLVRNELAGLAAANPPFPGTEWKTANYRWADTLHHEMFHTVQYNLKGGSGDFWFAYWLFARESLFESGATLAQDWFGPDADDASVNIDDVGDPGVVGSYAAQLVQLLRQPVKPTFVQGGDDYEVGAIFQYWGERFGVQAEDDLEARVAGFLREMTEAGGLGSAPYEAATGINAFAALRDFWVAAYVRELSGIPNAYRILDEEYPTGEPYTPGGPQGTSPSVGYPDVLVAVDDSESLATASFTEQSLDSGRGRIYEVTSLPPGTNLVSVSLNIDPTGLVGDGDLHVAAVPTSATSAVVGPRNFWRTSIWAGPQSQIVGVGGFDTLGIVLAAAGDMPHDLVVTDVNYDLVVTDVSGTPDIDIITPTTAAPRAIGTPGELQEFTVVVEPTIDGAPVPGELGASNFSVAIGGDPAAGVEAVPIDGGERYELHVQPPATLGAGFHDLAVTFVGVTDTEVDAVTTEAVQAAVALVIDNSGSMGGAPIAAAKDAAIAFIDNMEFGDQVAVITFNSTATVRHNLAFLSATTRDSVIASIQGIAAGGGTNIGVGIDAANAQLTSAEAGYARAQVLLSDGNGSLGTSVQNTPDDVEIHTIALGSANQALLEGVANDTGGTFQIAPDESDLDELYLLIRAEVSATETSAAGSLGELGQGQSATSAFVVVDGTLVLRAGLRWIGSDFDLTLTSPSGRIIDEESTDADVTIDHGADFVTIEVDSPEGGAWHLEAFGADVPSPEEVAFRVEEAGSPIRSQLYLDGAGQAGQPIEIRLLLTEQGTGFPDATVTATVTDPVGVERHFALTDDGGQRDGRAGDGLYGARVFGTNVSGSYTVAVHATGVTSAGDTFDRHELAATFLAEMVDTDGDGVADAIELAMGLDPADPLDAAADPDGDGLSIAEELALGSDPFVADTDRGGEHDGSEDAAGRDPLVGQDDLAFPDVLLAAGLKDGNVVSVVLGTEDGSGSIELSRLTVTSSTPLGTHSGAGTTIDDGPLAAGEYWYEAVAVAPGGARSDPVRVGPYSPAADVTPPSVLISVNGGTWATADPTVDIEFVDLSEPVTDMRLAESEEELESATWVPYATPTMFTVGSEPGIHIVHAQVRDAAGNISAPATGVVDLVDPGLLAADGFDRSEATGWGTPDLGDPYTVTAASDLAVAGGVGTITPSSVNAFKSARLLGVSAQDVDLTVRVSTDRLAAGGDQNAYVEVRHLDTTNFYRLRLGFEPDQEVVLQWHKVAGGVTDTIAAETEVPGLSHAADAWFNLRVQAEGTDPTSLRAKVWADGSAEPAGWTLTASDAEPALQQSLAVGLRALLGSGASTGPVFRFDDLAVRVLEGTPAADFAVSATTGSAPLTVFFDDTSAGGPTSWDWDFGDGTLGSGANPTHVYASPGTYTVELTVTNANGEDTETKTDYVVVDGDDAYLARDRFERTASNGWGSADIGGSYTVSTPADGSVADGQGILRPSSLNALRSARLLGVEVGDVDVLVRVDTDQLAAGNSQSAYLELRHPGANDGYRLRLSLEPDGSILLWWQKVVAGSTSSVSGLHTVTREQRVSAEDGFWIRAQAEGSSPTTLRARAWQDGTPEPIGWDVTGSDSSATLQAPNAIGLRALLGSGTTNAPVQVRFDELSAVELVGGQGLMAQAAGSGPDAEGLLLAALGAKVASRCVEYGAGAELPPDWQARADAIAARRTPTGWLISGSAWVGDLASATTAFGGSRVADGDGHAWLLRKAGPTWFGSELREELTARGTSVWTLDDPIHVLPAGECR
jgi:PKD repeat protein/uncharacterized protein YegL